MLLICFHCDLIHSRLCSISASSHIKVTGADLSDVMFHSVHTFKRIPSPVLPDSSVKDLKQKQKHVNVTWLQSADASHLSGYEWTQW